MVLEDHAIRTDSYTGAPTFITLPGGGGAGNAGRIGREILEEGLVGMKTVAGT